MLREARHILIPGFALFGSLLGAIAAPKVSVTCAETLDVYSKVYAAPIRHDIRKVQPRLVERLKKAGLETVDLSRERLPFASQGTGFVLSPEGWILTSAHVAGREAYATLWAGTNRCMGRVMAVDTNLDVAMILVEGPHPPLQPLRFLPASKQRIGQEVFTMGFPAADVLGNRPRLSKGVINSTSGLNDDERHVQISIPIQPGNSGSPLLDEDGCVIGMVSARINPLRVVLLEGGVPQNVNFALKSEFLAAFLAASKAVLPEATTNRPAVTSSRTSDVFETAAKSLVLVRGGIVDEQRLMERPLLCGCVYSEVLKGQFFRLRIVFLEVRKVAVVLTVELAQSSTWSEDKVLDVMFEEICDRLLPSKPNPFKPKKRRSPK